MKVSLLEYLDKLEATAKAADERTHGALSAMTAGKIDDEMGPWGAGWTDSIQAHILATQPRATLALIAKLREALAWSGAANSGCAGDLMTIEVPE